MFATIAFDLDGDTFLVYITFFTSFDLGLEVHSFCKAQIAFSKTDKTLISIFFHYANFINIFSKDLVLKLLEHAKINNYFIKLVKSQ